MKKENLRKVVQRAEQSVYSINTAHLLTTAVDDKVITALECIIQAIRGLEELEDEK